MQRLLILNCFVQPVQGDEGSRIRDMAYFPVAPVPLPGLFALKQLFVCVILALVFVQ